MKIVYIIAVSIL